MPVGAARTTHVGNRHHLGATPVVCEWQRERLWATVLPFQRLEQRPRVLGQRVVRKPAALGPTPGPQVEEAAWHARQVVRIHASVALQAAARQMKLAKLRRLLARHASAGVVQKRAVGASLAATLEIKLARLAPQSRAGPVARRPLPPLPAAAAAILVVAWPPPPRMLVRRRMPRRHTIVSRRRRPGRVLVARARVLQLLQHVQKRRHGVWTTQRKGLTERSRQREKGVQG